MRVTFIGINVSNSSVENCYSSATIVSYRQQYKLLETYWGECQTVYIMVEYQGKIIVMQ